ncbi:MAG: family 16 glycoside hydrolase [Bacteroidota bacterium]
MVKESLIERAMNNFFLTIVAALTLFSCSEEQNRKGNLKFPNKLEVNSVEQFAISKWLTNDDNNWEVKKENGEFRLNLLHKGEFGAIRKPSSFAVLKDLDITDFELTLEAKSLVDSTIKGRDVIVYFAFQDSLHFYYVHVSNENHKYHNIIGVVNGSDRLPITTKLEEDSKARLHGYEWHKIKIVRKIESGSVKVYVDDMDKPIHDIQDKTLMHGSVGVGSFDDYGSFRNIKLMYNSDKKKK